MSYLQELQDAIDLLTDDKYRPPEITDARFLVLKAARRVANPDYEAAAGFLSTLDDIPSLAHPEEVLPFARGVVDAALHTEREPALAKGAAAYADEDLTIAEQTSRLSLEDITIGDCEKCDDTGWYTITAAEFECRHDVTTDLSPDQWMSFPCDQDHRPGDTQ